MIRERHTYSQTLRRLLSESDVGAVFRITEHAPRVLGQSAEQVVLELVKAGVGVPDLRYAVDATARTCSRFPDADPERVALFVAAAAAIGRLSGADLLLLPTLYGYAR